MSLTSQASRDTVGASDPLSDPLSAWKPGVVKSSISNFLGSVTQRGGSGFVPPARRVAVFDLDGTLLCEKPHFFEIEVAMARVRESARAAEAGGNSAAFEPPRGGCPDDILLSAFRAVTLRSYRRHMLRLLKQLVHPRFDSPLLDLVYTPMLQLVRELRRHDFTVLILSGSQQGFVQTVASNRIGLRSRQAAGRRVDVRFRESGLRLRNRFRDPALAGRGKIDALGRMGVHRPIFAAGNAMGDRYMLRLAESRRFPCLQMVVDHDDSRREYAYRDSRLLELAHRRGWTVCRMSRHFECIFDGVSSVKRPAP